MAKENLKWNDYCVSLFWDMLTLAICYLHIHHDNSAPSRREDTLVDIELVGIFLILHVCDATPSKPSTPPT
ncbi:hypothetical protein EON64_13125, partial [archaeon]